MEKVKGKVNPYFLINLWIVNCSILLVLIYINGSMYKYVSHFFLFLIVLIYYIASLVLTFKMNRFVKDVRESQNETRRRIENLNKLLDETKLDDQKDQSVRVK